MKKTIILLAMVSLIVASGCATAPIMWTKNGGTEEGFKRDNYQCIQESRTQWSGGGSGLIGIGMIVSSQMSAQQQANKLYRMCMESKGYHESNTMPILTGASNRISGSRPTPDERWISLSTEKRKEEVKKWDTWNPGPINESALRESKSYADYIYLKQSR